MPRFPLIRVRSPRTQVAVAHRAQRFTQPLLAGVVAVEDQSPRIVVLHCLLQIASQLGEELANGVRTFETKGSGRPSITVFVVAHHNPDTGEAHGIKGIFVGKVVADVDRQP